MLEFLWKPLPLKVGLGSILEASPSMADVPPAVMMLESCLLKILLLSLLAKSSNVCLAGYRDACPPSCLLTLGKAMLDMFKPFLKLSFLKLLLFEPINYDVSSWSRSLCISYVDPYENYIFAPFFPIITGSIYGVTTLFIFYLY